MCAESIQKSFKSSYAVLGRVCPHLRLESQMRIDTEEGRIRFELTKGPNFSPFDLQNTSCYQLLEIMQIAKFSQNAAIFLFASQIILGWGGRRQPCQSLWLLLVKALPLESPTSGSTTTEGRKVDSESLEDTKSQHDLRMREVSLKRGTCCIRMRASVHPRPLPPNLTLKAFEEIRYNGSRVRHVVLEVKGRIKQKRHGWKGSRATGYWKGSDLQCIDARYAEGTKVTQSGFEFHLRISLTCGQQRV